MEPIYVKGKNDEYLLTFRLFFVPRELLSNRIGIRYLHSKLICEMAMENVDFRGQFLQVFDTVLIF